ncbi:methyltransferase [Chitinophaga agrisoli]|uniref:tRNA1(Val) (adenine(37)-N6)-methyltransferase n=1 Tax=Chitinophaga agrisoli TaxID=2607653 RepID=A0A5B2VXD5_9BACT|nr:methyltransferase [Chitinophaga agrisoli]KAA2242866.1 methyltransferase [Chitinophaga agrisoli]
MSNQYFRFKQFTVHQDKCAMKVCTDACIQGAFTAGYLARQSPVPQQILDIGTGTGLLSLLLAQQIPAFITGVELDSDAAGQAAENFSASPWAERLQVTQSDIRYLPATSHYDHIISNPPFYEGSLKSNNNLRNQAMHATTLGYTELLEAIGSHLQPEGTFSVLLPHAAFPAFREQAEAIGFYPEELLEVRQSVRHAGPFRTVGIFKQAVLKPEIRELTIYDEGNAYTPAFVELLQPYYLYL